MQSRLKHFKNVLGFFAHFSSEHFVCHARL